MLLIGINIFKNIDYTIHWAGEHIIIIIISVGALL